MVAKPVIPVVDLTRQYVSLQEELHPAVQGVMASGQYILGHNVAEFEAEFAAYCGAKYAVAVGSGTEAIRLALQAAGLKPGDQVISVAFTAVPTIAAIIAAQGQPVLVDIDPKTFGMDAAKVEAAITPRTKAIVPVHLFGHPVDMDPLLELAARFGLVVVEDACQAHGSLYQGRKVGGLGRVGCFSFYPTKNLGALGDGGMVVTNDRPLAEKVRLLRNHGQSKRFYHVEVALNSRFDELQAAILRVKLPYLDGWNTRRRHLAALYRQALEGQPLSLPMESPWAKPNYHLYVVRVKERDAFRQRLTAKGIGSDVHYPLPVHLQPAYRHLGWRQGDLPVSEQAAREVVTLPLYSELTDDEALRVVEAVKAVLKAPSTSSSQVAAPKERAL